MVIKQGNMTPVILNVMIFWCGIGHVVLCLGSLGIPKTLKWKAHLATLPRLLRQMFWTYAGYILSINLFFGVISIFGSSELLNGSFVSGAITFFIGIYWLARVVIQFVYFDRSQAPEGIIFLVAEVMLVALFVIFTLVYLTSFAFNLKWF